MIDQQTFKDEYRRCLDRADLTKLDALYAGADAAHEQGNSELDAAMNEAIKEFAAEHRRSLSTQEREEHAAAARLRALVERFTASPQT